MSDPSSSNGYFSLGGTASFSCKNSTETLNNNQGSEKPKKSSWLCGLSALLGRFRFVWSFSTRKQQSDASEKTSDASEKTSDASEKTSDASTNSTSNNSNNQIEHFITSRGNTNL